MRNHSTTSFAVLSVLAIAGSSLAAERVIDSVAGPDIDIPTGGATQTVTFSDAASPATGFAIDAQWTAVVADTGGGLYPWPLDLSVEITAPDASVSTWGPEIFGDISFADYPFQDGDRVLPGTTSSGTYELAFGSEAPAPYVMGLRDVTYYLTTTVPDVTFSETFTPDPAQMWDRPFSISGVSGLGPVAYDALEFTVDTSGVYDFTSVLMPTGNHFTFLYENAFDPAQPLTNLLDYGLGNGFSPFDVPQGTSAFSALLLEGETYYWITSQWSASSSISPATNTIVGPGNVQPAGLMPCVGDCNDSGDVSFDDLVAMLFEFGNDAGVGCDADDSGTVDFNDLVAALFAFGPCP